MNNDNNKNNGTPPQPDEGLGTEDSIELHTGSVKDRVIERKIRPAPVVHTSGSDEIHIPDDDGDTVTDTVMPRFIKTNATPLVSVSPAEEPESGGSEIDRYSDRFTVRPPERKPFTGYTAKLNIYPTTHSASPEDGRMIIPTDDGGESFSLDGDAPIPTEEEVREDAAGEEASGDPVEDILTGDAPTRPVPDPKGALLREIADTADEGVRRNPDQLMMEGFDSVGQKGEEEIDRERREDEELRSELIKTRQKRISAFKFWGKQNDDNGGETDDEKFTEDTAKKALPGFLQKIADHFEHFDTSFTPVNGDEYDDFNKRKDVFNSLMGTRKAALYRLIVVGILGAALFFIDLAAAVSASSSANGFFSVFNGNYTVFVTVNLVLLLFGCVVMFRDLKAGLLSLLKVHPKADTSLLFMMAAVLVQTVCAYFTQLKLEENFHLLAPAALLLCVPYLAAKLFYYDNARHCFKAAAAKSDKSYLRRIADESLVAELLRDRESGARNVVYAGKTRFIGNFLTRSADSAYAGMPSSRCVLITAGAALVVALIVAIVKQDAVYGITAAGACLALSFPVSCLAVTGFRLSSENKKLSVKSSFVQSYTDARDFAAVDNIVLNASDVFKAEVKGCLTAPGVSEKQAKFCAAVLTSGFGGPLNAALMESVSALEDRFPAAENLVYEEKLGLSAWVSNCKVLLGTHALLVNHNVPMPDEKDVIATLGGSGTPVYLALEGKFAAVFAVDYSCPSEVADDLRELVKGGTTLLLSCFDSGISETFAEELLGLPECSVRIISPAAAEKLGSSMHIVTESEDAGIVFTDSVESLCRCACAAVKLDRAKKTAKLVCEAGSYMSLLLAAILALTGSFSGLSSVLPVMLQVLWLALCFVAPLFFSSSVTELKKNIVRPHAARTGSAVPQEEREDGSDEAEADAAEIGDETAETAGTPEKHVPAKDGDRIDIEIPIHTSPAPAPAPAPAPEPEEEPGVISQKTFDALDALAGDTEPARRRKKADAPAKESDDAENADEAEEGESDKGFDLGGMILDVFDKVKEFFLGLIGRFTKRDDAEEDEEDETDDGETDGVTESAGDRKEAKRPFTATIPVRKRRAEHRDDGSDAIREAREEARMRASFTPPEMPAAPHYELGTSGSEHREEPASFVPPANDNPSYFTDSMFTAFEDDDIFAALHDDDNDTSGGGFDF